MGSHGYSRLKYVCVLGKEEITLITRQGYRLVVGLLLTTTWFLDISAAAIGDYRTEAQVGMYYTRWLFAEVFEESVQRDHTVQSLDDLESKALLQHYSVSFWAGDYNLVVDYIGDRVFRQEEQLGKRIRAFIGLPLFEETRWFFSGTSGIFDWKINNGPREEYHSTDYREIKTGMLFELDDFDSILALGVSHYHLERPGIRKVSTPFSFDQPGKISKVTISSYNIMLGIYSETMYEAKQGGIFGGSLGLGRASIKDSVLGTDTASSVSEEIFLGYKWMLLRSRWTDLGLILGGEFQGQMYGGYKGESGTGHIDHQWSLSLNLQAFFGKSY